MKTEDLVQWWGVLNMIRSGLVGSAVLTVTAGIYFCG